MMEAVTILAGKVDFLAIMLLIMAVLLIISWVITAMNFGDKAEKYLLTIANGEINRLEEYIKRISERTFEGTVRMEKLEKYCGAKYVEGGFFVALDEKDV